MMSSLRSGDTDSSAYPAVVQSARPRRYSSKAIAIWNDLGASLGIRNASSDKNGVVWSVWLACRDGIDDLVMHELSCLLDKAQMDKLLEMVKYEA